MTKLKSTYSQFLKTLTILHLALMMAQLIFIALIFVLVNEENTIIDISTQNLLLISVPILVIGIIILGKYFYQQKLKKTQLKTDLKKKLKEYQSLQIVHFAFSEVGALTCFLSSFLSQNLVFVYGSIGVLLYFLTIKPSKLKLEKELDLDFKDQQLLDDPSFEF
jgi:hypothetical protein